MLLNLIKNKIEELHSQSSEFSDLIYSIFATVKNTEVYRSSTDGEDKIYRVPLVNLQAAFELAVAELLDTDNDYSCTAIIHTPTLVKPLNLYAPDHEFLKDGVAPEIREDEARLDTVKIRGERSLPAFMKAGGLVIAAAEDTNLDEERKKRFQVHQKEYGDRLVTEKLSDFSKDMIGASYILKNNKTGEVTFAFIRASQSDDVSPKPWIFGVGNSQSANIAEEYQKTLKHFRQFIK